MIVMYLSKIIIIIMYLIYLIKRILLAESCVNNINVYTNKYINIKITASAFDSP